MATTPVYAWPYQSLSDAPNGPTLGHDMALAIEATMVALQAELDGVEALLLSAWTDYTPVLVASGSAFAIGNGLRAGRYIAAGKLGIAQAIVKMGTTTTFGTGAYTVSLPFTLRNNGFNILGPTAGALLDSGAAFYMTGGYATSTTAVLLQIGTAPIGATSPFTFAANDEVAITYIGEIA